MNSAHGEGWETTLGRSLGCARILRRDCGRLVSPTLRAAIRMTNHSFSLMAECGCRDGKQYAEDVVRFHEAVPADQPGESRE